MNIFSFITNSDKDLHALQLYGNIFTDLINASIASLSRFNSLDTIPLI